MVTHLKITWNHQIFRAALCVVSLMLIAWPSRSQELKGTSSTLAAKMGELGRKRVAVVDFTDLQGNVTELGRFLAEELSGALVNDSRGFRVIDRAHLKAILQEHKLASTGIIDPQTARQLGKIASVDTLVAGTITSAFGETVRVLVKALDVETADILAQSTADIPKTDAIKSLLGQGIQGSSSGGMGPNPQEPPKPSAAFSVEANDLLFVMKTCKRSGENLTCEGSVTNKGRQRRNFYFGQQKFVDNVGNDYSNGNFPVFRTKSNQAILEPDLGYNFWAEQKDIDPTATAITVVLDYGAEGFFGQQKVAFRKMPIIATSTQKP